MIANKLTGFHALILTTARQRQPDLHRGWDIERLAALQPPSKRIAIDRENPLFPAGKQIKKRHLTLLFSASKAILLAKSAEDSLRQQKCDTEHFSTDNSR